LIEYTVGDVRVVMPVIVSPTANCAGPTVRFRVKPVDWPAGTVVRTVAVFGLELYFTTVPARIGAVVVVIWGADEYVNNVGAFVTVESVMVDPAVTVPFVPPEFVTVIWLRLAFTDIIVELPEKPVDDVTVSPTTKGKF
jgi:hypothetical protein